MRVWASLQRAGQCVRRFPRARFARHTIAVRFGRNPRHWQESIVVGLKAQPTHVLLREQRAACIRAGAAAGGKDAVPPGPERAVPGISGINEDRPVLRPVLRRRRPPVHFPFVSDVISHAHGRGGIAAIYRRGRFLTKERSVTDENGEQANGGCYKNRDSNWGCHAKVSWMIWTASYFSLPRVDGRRQRMSLLMGRKRRKHPRVSRFFADYGTGCT